MGTPKEEAKNYDVKIVMIAPPEMMNKEVKELEPYHAPTPAFAEVMEVQTYGPSKE